MNDHPSWEEILNAIERPEALDGALVEHLKTCDACLPNRKEAQALLDLLESGRLPEIPPAVLDRTRARLAAAFAEDDRTRLAVTAAELLSEAVQRTKDIAADIASLVADSWQPAVGVRGVATDAQPRVLRYESGAYAITFSLVDADDGGRSILGQVVPDEGVVLPPGGSAIVQTGGTSHRAALSPHGEFRLRELTRELPELMIAVGSDRIRVPIPSGGGARE